MTHQNQTIVYFLFVVFLLFSCETVDFGDMNKNENGPSELNTAALLAGSQRIFATSSGRAYRNNPSLYVQYQAQPTYQDESRYTETPFGWGLYYVQNLSNLQQIISISNDESKNSLVSYVANGSANNQLGVARIMKVLVFKRLTDIYGDIPYFESLNPENLTPAYTAQKDIYTDFIKELKEARDQLNGNENLVTGDLVYNGDVELWKKFANSLLLSVCIQLSDRYPEATGMAAVEFNNALNHDAGLIEQIDDEAWFVYLNANTLSNPWSKNRPADYNLSEFFISSLKGKQSNFSNKMVDQRVMIFANDTTLAGLPYGLSDYSNYSDDYAKQSSYISSATSPLSWMTASYTYLNRAEAAQLGWTIEDAKSMLELGIRSSYASLEKRYQQNISSDIDNYVSARLMDAQTNLEQVIGEEKWISLVTDVFQAWAEFRRTNYPTLSPSPAPLNAGSIPTRYLYPTTEQTQNGENYKTGVSSLSPSEDKNTSKIWWDVN